MDIFELCGDFGGGEMLTRREVWEGWSTSSSCWIKGGFLKLGDVERFLGVRSHSRNLYMFVGWLLKRH